MELREGYKKTEIGVIPDEWDVKTIGQIGFFSKGKGIRKDEAQSGDIPCVRYGELYTLHGDYIKFFGSFISREVSRTSKKLKSGDILFAGSGETKEEIGKSAAFLYDIEAYAGGDVIILSPQYGDSLFYGFLFNSTLVNKQKANKGQGDAIVHIHASSLSDILIPLPPHPEQQAIAAVLSDVDGLISSLTKLINKRKNIKQGAMQELLTGMKRLEGFSGEWVQTTLDEVCEMITTGKLDANAMKREGQYRFYTCAKDYFLIDEYAFDAEALLISGNGANVGYIHYYKGKFNAYQRTYVIIGFTENILFIKLFLEKHLADRISTEVNAGNTPYIKMDTLTDMIISLPATREEQTAIANILSDMDTEIEALEQKLNKYKTIKQGMMQELLTGRIRLV